MIGCWRCAPRPPRWPVSISPSPILAMIAAPIFRVSRPRRRRRRPWALVESFARMLRISRRAILPRPPAAFHAYLNAPGHRGHLFEPPPPDRVEQRVTAPSPVFNCVGPASVGIGSLAGVPLHALTEAVNQAAVARAADGRLDAVEIFRAFISSWSAPTRGRGPIRTPAAAIAGWDSAPPASARVASEDEADVIARGPRRLADRPAVGRRLPRPARRPAWKAGYSGSSGLMTWHEHAARRCLGRRRRRCPTL